MWYPFYYSPEVDENTPIWGIVAMIVIGLPALLAVYTALWFLPAMVFGFFNWAGWFIGLAIFAFACTWPIIIPKIFKIK